MILHILGVKDTHGKTELCKTHLNFIKYIFVVSHFIEQVFFMRKLNEKFNFMVFSGMLR